jgi:hypothetical protein
MTVGALVTGFLGDRYGRRFTYQINLLIFGLASFAAAFAPDMTTLNWLRFVMGLGLGAEIVVGYGTLTERRPDRTTAWRRQRLGLEPKLEDWRIGSRDRLPRAGTSASRRAQALAGGEGAATSPIRGTSCDRFRPSRCGCGRYRHGSTSRRTMIHRSVNLSTYQPA